MTVPVYCRLTPIHEQIVHMAIFRWNLDQNWPIWFTISIHQYL